MVKRLEQSICGCVRFASFIIPLQWGQVAGLSFAFQTDRADFTDWIFFQSSNIMEDISPNTEKLSANT